MDELDTLSMNHNLLTSLSAGDFEGMPRLTSLSLDYNKVTKIDAEAFRGLEGNLATISITHNKLRDRHEINNNLAALFDTVVVCSPIFRSRCTGANSTNFTNFAEQISHIQFQKYEPTGNAKYYTFKSSADISEPS